MPDPRSYRNVGANTAGTDAAGTSGAQTMNAMSAAAGSGGSPAQRLAEANEVRAAEGATCDRCGRPLGNRDFVRRTAAGDWRHESCPPGDATTSS